MNWHDGASSWRSRWDTGMKTIEHPRASVLVTNQKKHTHQWQLMGARVKIVWKTKSCKMSDILHSNPGPHGTSDQTSPPWEWTRPPYRRLTMLLGMSMRIHHTREVSSSPASPFTFHFHDMLTRALYNRHRYRYRYLPADRIPIFSFTSQPHRAYPSQHAGIIFWSIEMFRISLVTNPLE